MATAPAKPANWGVDRPSTDILTRSLEKAIHLAPGRLVEETNPARLSGARPHFIAPPEGRLRQLWMVSIEKEEMTEPPP